MLIAGEAVHVGVEGQWVYGNFLLDFAVNLSLLQKVKSSIFLKRLILKQFHSHFKDIGILRL